MTHGPWRRSVVVGRMDVGGGGLEVDAPFMGVAAHGRMMVGIVDEQALTVHVQQAGTVGLREMFDGQNLGWFAPGHNPAGQEDGVIGYAGLGEIMRGHDDGAAPGMLVVNHIVDRLS